MNEERKPHLIRMRQRLDDLTVPANDCHQVTASADGGDCTSHSTTATLCAYALSCGCVGSVKVGLAESCYQKKADM